MSLLRPRTARAIKSWPQAPVVYHRPFLRTVTALFLIGMLVLYTSDVWFPPPDDPLLASDWWLGLGIFAMLGGLHLFASSKLRITSTHVEISNPLRRATIPLAHVTGATAGSNLRVETAYNHFNAWGVEAANAQMAADNLGTQDDLVTLIEEAAHAAPADDGPPARYRLTWPDPLFLLTATVMAVDAVVLAMTGPSA